VANIKKLAEFLILLVFMAALLSCQSDVTYPTIAPCEWEFTETMNEQIPIVSVTAEQSTITGSVENFIHPCKPEREHALLFSESRIKTHQVIVSLDAIYPIQQLKLTLVNDDEIKKIETLSIDFSLNGIFYNRVVENKILDPETTIIPFSNESARYLRLVFPATGADAYGIQDLRLFLGDGLIVKEETEWTNAFLRYEFWTGADGIFSFNLNGDDTLGASSDSTLFIFSDTMVGDVNPSNGLRQSNRMINNSFAYYDGTTPVSSGLDFVYGLTDEQIPKSPFLPDYYLGFPANNLLDSDGLNCSFDPEGLLTNEANGISWLSPNTDHLELIADFYQAVALKDIYLWNFNEIPDLGVEEFELLSSNDGINWTSLGVRSIQKASGSQEEPMSLRVTFTDLTCRYLKIRILSGYDSNRVGLGKLLFLDSSGNPVFAEITATDQIPEVTGNELTGRLWLQDGIVLGDYFYCFPLLVKDEGSLFRVTRIGLIKVPIVDSRIDFEQAVYRSTPLMSIAPDGGEIYFGAGVMNHTSEDGYIYVYGYKDLNGRHLVVARVLADEFENFNAWTYYDGTGWSSNPVHSAPLIEGVSPELSVTLIPSGAFAGKYMLVAEQNTTSGRIVYSLADHPEGPFSPFQLLYEATEHVTLRGGMTYNAKMHPHLSTYGNYLISYNVNTTILSALVDVNIYHPRFIRVIEVKKP